MKGGLNWPETETEREGEKKKVARVGIPTVLEAIFDHGFAFAWLMAVVIVIAQLIAPCDLDYRHLFP